MRQGFKSKVEVLKHKIFKETPVKMVNSKPISGKMLASLIERYVEAMKRGVLPDVSSA